MDNRLGSRLSAWVSIGCPEHICKWLSHGVPLPFISTVKPFTLSNHNLTKVQRQFVTKELKQLVTKGAIEVCNYVPFCVNPLGCVPKKNNKLRLITDLRWVNTNIKAPKFRNEDIRTTLELVEEGDACVTADLKDCFYHIKVDIRYRDYLGFKWNNTYYRWKVLPFGLNISPYYCAKILRPVIQYLRSLDIKVQVFVDDFWLCGSWSTITDHTDLLVHTLQDLGWLINWDKSQLSPSNTKEYLGWLVDTTSLVIKVTQARVKKLKRKLSYCLRKCIISARQLARVAGQCVAMTIAIIPGKMMLRGVYHLLSTKTSWESMLVLTDRARADLEWWQASVTQWNGGPIKKRTIDIQMTTDASSIGWGAKIMDREASGTWTSHLANQPSNVREIMAILLGLLTFRDSIKNQHLQVLSDNVSSIANVNRYGGPTSKLTQIARAIWNVALRLNVTITARHLSGHLNCDADRLSRVVDKHNWMLHPGLFMLLNRRFGPHTVDRFASFSNTQLKRYNSRYLDPFTEGVDALAQTNWGEENNYCNPPWRLIPQILNVIVAQQADATLIAPMWKAQPWYLKLKKLSVTHPIILPSHPCLFLNMGGVPEPLRHNKWKVAVYRISGKNA